MPTPRVLVLRSPGTNCDEETAKAFELAGAATERVHINRLLEEPKQLENFQALCFPGGFSYGDDVAAGRVLGNRVRLNLANELKQFRDADKLVLGICNGFQVLMKTGLLDVDDAQGPQATLEWNDHGRYEARWVELAVEGTKSVFLKGCEHLELPIAHAEGKISVRDQATFDGMKANGQVVLRYTDGNGDAAGMLPFPTNPNGAFENTAGLCDSSGRVLGLMPHPERFIDRCQHPQWTRRPADASVDGLKLFKNAVDYFG